VNPSPPTKIAMKLNLATRKVALFFHSGILAEFPGGWSHDIFFSILFSEGRMDGGESGHLQGAPRLIMATSAVVKVSSRVSARDVTVRGIAVCCHDNGRAGQVRPSLPRHSTFRDSMK